MAEQCHAAGVIFVFACLWTKVAQVDKFRGHFFVFASSWTKMAQTDKFRGHFFGFASLWTKVAQADKLKGRQCILLYFFIYLIEEKEKLALDQKLGSYIHSKNM